MFMSSAALLITPALLLSQLPFSQQDAQPNLNQRLAMYSKPAVVRILAGCVARYEYRGVKYPYDSSAIGTGFFIDSNGYIVTNAHVASLAEGGAEACRERLRNNLIKGVYGDLSGRKIKDIKDVPLEMKEDIAKAAQESEESFAYYNDVILPNGNSSSQEGVFDFEIKELGSSLIDEARRDTGKDVAVIKIEVRDAPALPLGDSDKVRTPDPAIVLGYPVAADVMSALSNKSIYEASVLPGQVSSTRKELKNSSPVLQLSVPVSIGISGSPALNQAGEVIGMITFAGRSKDEETNFSYAVPTNTILEFTKKSGAENNLSDTDLLYKEGLDSFWKGDFEGAKVKFEQVRGLFPRHSEVDDLIRQSEQQITKRWANRSYVPLLAGVGVAIAGLLGAYFVVRRRATPALVNGLADTGIDEANSTTQYERDRQRSSRSAAQPMTVLSSERRQPSTVIALQPSLELKNTQGEEVHFVLRKDRHQLGRDRTWADLKVPDDGWEVLSKRHATLERDGEGYRIYDGDRKGNFSTNGIAVKGLLISPEGHLLKDGDRLTIGQDPHNQVDIVYHTVSRSSAPRSEASYRDGNG